MGYPLLMDCNIENLQRDDLITGYESVYRVVSYISEIDCLLVRDVEDPSGKLTVIEGKEFNKFRVCPW